MAFIDVEVEESGGERTYPKFNAIGDRVAGYYVGKSVNTRGNFGPKDEYTFRDKAGVDQTIEPPVDLARRIEKAIELGMKPGCPAISEFKSTRDIGKDNPMKVFTFKFDPEARQLPKPKARPAAQPSRSQPPPPGFDDSDIPF